MCLLFVVIVDCELYVGFVGFDVLVEVWGCLCGIGFDEYGYGIV